MKKVTLGLVLFSFTILNSAQAAMQSQNFRVYDIAEESSVVISSPTISNITVSTTDSSATISWQTSDLADSYVLYALNSGVVNPQEVGSADKTSNLHNVTLLGLNPATSYYFKIRSTNATGGASLSTVLSFTTAVRVVVNPSVGGGLLILDKHDTNPPVISNIMVSEGSDTATLSWQTDENANSFVEYYEVGGAKKMVGQWDTAKAHIVILDGLTPATYYNYRVVSADGSGNVASSTVSVFTTLNDGEKSSKPATMPVTPPKAAGGRVVVDTTNLNLSDLFKKTLASIGDYSLKAQAGQFEFTMTDYFNAAKKLITGIPGPQVVGKPNVKLDGDHAVISWATNKESGSQLALASAKQYDAKKSEPYYQFLGNAENLSLAHSVEIYGLEPDTLYHYQIRNQSTLGITTRSMDYTFKTLPELAGVSNYNVEIVSPQKVIFRWVTSQETDTSLRRTPYRGDVLLVADSKTFYDKTYSIIHQVEIDDFEGGVPYEVELAGKTKKSEAVSRKIDKFSTSKDNLPPEITLIKADIAIIPGKQDRAQAVISWETNEPAVSKLYFQAGAVDFQPSQEQQLVEDKSFSKKHVVVLNKFTPGQAYSYRVENSDASGNKTLSPVHTVYVPRKPESLIDLIIKYFRQIFGWIGNVRL